MHFLCFGVIVGGLFDNWRSCNASWQPLAKTDFYWLEILGGLPIMIMFWALAGVCVHSASAVPHFLLCPTHFHMHVRIPPLHEGPPGHLEEGLMMKLQQCSTTCLCGCFSLAAPLYCPRLPHSLSQRYPFVDDWHGYKVERKRTSTFNL